MEPQEIDLIRDAALQIEGKDLETAYRLMSLAHKHRPHGNLIKNKKESYKKQIQINNGPTNVHFGVHKTATTFIQENLECITDNQFQYTKLDNFREKIKTSGYLNYLNTLDWKKMTLISDENMIGGNGTILTGSLYPDFRKRAERFLFPFKNRDLINVFISIRPITSFLPSQYCEYLRWHAYMPYEKFTAKTTVTKLKWIDVLHDTIRHNSDLKFHIFDFSNFGKNKEILLSKLSFGLMQQCNRSIQPSRASFTHREIWSLSHQSHASTSDQKFDPHTPEEKRLSALNYQQDIEGLAGFDNVHITQ